MRTTFLILLCVKIVFMQLLIAQIAPAMADENDAKAIHVSMNVGEIVAFAEENEEMAKVLKMAILEVSDDLQVKNLDEVIEKANEVVGMDIRKDLHSLNFQLDSWSSLGDDLLLELELADVILHTSKQGNLQGLLLMAPGYSSEETSSGNVHVIKVNDEQSVFVKIVETDSGVFTTASMNKERLEEIGTEVSKSQYSPSDYQAGEMLRAVVGRSTFVGMVDEIGDANSPPAKIVRNMVSSMQELTLVLGREEKGVSIELTSVMDSAAKAEQQFQAIKGGKAIAKMFLQSEGAPEQVKQVVQMIDSLEVELDENNVEVRLVVPSIEDAIKIIESM